MLLIIPTECMKRSELRTKIYKKTTTKVHKITKTQKRKTICFQKRIKNEVYFNCFRFCINFAEKILATQQ